jgi:hypothetical protein
VPTRLEGTSQFNLPNMSHMKVARNVRSATVVITPDHAGGGRARTGGGQDAKGRRAAQTVVFLETMAALVQKSPVTYSPEAATDLAAHIRSMADAVTTDDRVEPAILDTARQCTALD